MTHRNHLITPKFLKSQSRTKRTIKYQLVQLDKQNEELDDKLVAKMINQRKCYLTNYIEIHTIVLATIFT